MAFENYMNGDGNLIGRDQCVYEVDNIVDFVQCGLLDYCLCGNPEDNLAYVLGGLELIHSSCPEGVNFKVWFSEHQKKVLAHFGTHDSAMFFYYWADKEGWTEHGGSVPGWLTEDGLDLLLGLREWHQNCAKEALN
jgi:hypothetical protein